MPLPTTYGLHQSLVLPELFQEALRVSETHSCWYLFIFPDHSEELSTNLLKSEISRFAALQNSGQTQSICDEVRI